MNMSLRLTLSLTFLTTISTLSLAKESVPTTAARPWAQDSSDIKSDTNVTYGRLPNGMRYILMPNTQPPGRVSMRLHIAAGSLMERENQRGVAHFLEHMVFNGSKNFPDATKLIPQMQRLGIAFGAHANAYTSFDETVYMLDLPNNEPATLKLGFDVMRDFGDGALLQDDEIDKERGVILSEKTSRDSVRMRLMEQQFNDLLPDALLGKRFPIGTEEIIKSAPRSAFTDFYTQYYTPSRMTFIYTGDFDLKEAQQRIISTFGEMKNPPILGPDPILGKIPSSHGFKTLILSDKEVATTDLTLMLIKPFQHKPDTKANRAEKLPLQLANAILGRRFSTLAKKENSPITGGEAFHQKLFKFMEIGGISVNANNHDWKTALPVLEQELRRAIHHGFTPSELAEVKANIINAYQQALKAAPSRKTHNLASSLAEHIHNNSVFSTPEEDLTILRENIANITIDTCHQALKKYWQTADITLVMTTNTSQADDKTNLIEIYKKSNKTEVKAPEKKTEAHFAYTDFGKGAIAERSYIKDLDITQITFENGCRCNIKRTDFDQNSISLTTRVGGGKLTMPKDKPGLDIFANATFTAGGLGKHSADDLERILAGRNAGVTFQAGDDTFSLSGKTTPEDLQLQLQLLCAYLTDPGLRPEAERTFKAQLTDIFSQMKHTPAGAQTKMNAYLSGNDPRFIFPTPEQAKALSTEDVRKWITPALRDDYLELTLVGDLDLEKILPTLTSTIGALPNRSKAKPAYAAERTLANLPSPPAKKRYTFQSRIPTGTAIVFWKATDLNKNNIATIRRLGILSNILSNRLREKIREELGEAYSPYAGFQPSDTYKDLGYLVAISPGKPEQATRIGKIIIQIGDEFANGGATPDEFTRALAPRLSELKKSLRQNSYWQETVMSKSQEQPHHLQWARERDADYKAITLEEINTLAKKYLGEKNTLRFEIIPE